ncbi:hypothetical protein FG2_1153 [Lactococcus cremoris]|nr:hypothetical protein AB995_2399 [Lactococcus cremoris]KZK33810.1 hypothetical protein LMG6897_2374 [Lactococcus cremoris]KZK45625.1 hypothetical protein B40_0899 [Lactococcus cremoris]KZK47814.1 hypothetical protein FG2_1153 [Lactococcus cremoris]
MNIILCFAFRVLCFMYKIKYTKKEEFLQTIAPNIQKNTDRISVSIFIL